MSGSCTFANTSMSLSTMTNGPWKVPGGGISWQRSATAGGKGNSPPGIRCSPGYQMYFGWMEERKPEIYDVRDRGRADATR